MSGFGQWASMGGYAAFVWPAYGAAVAILGGIATQSCWRYSASLRELGRLQSRSRPRS
jgi:heme exporter protein CcmD